MLSNYPNHWLIYWINEAKKLNIFNLTIDMYERELESRQPEPREEYDSEGNLIVSEVMGYVEGVEIWS